MPQKRDWPLVAGRIFRRAELKEPWEEIARAGKVAVETVRETVERRAKEFQIPLPEFSPGPRPNLPPHPTNVKLPPTSWQKLSHP